MAEEKTNMRKDISFSVGRKGGREGGERDDTRLTIMGEIFRSHSTSFIWIFLFFLFPFD